MRFRLGEDEHRYLTLRSEVYLRLLPHLPQKTLVEVMRNLGKLEAMSYGEGIKQGMAVAYLGTAELDAMMPIAAHSVFYGDASTPLGRVESALAHADDAAHPWLTQKPVEFPPQTLAEALAAYGPTLDAAPNAEAPAPRTRPGWVRVEPDPGAEQVVAALAALDELPEEGDAPDPFEEQIAQDTADAKERGEDRAQSPDYLDRARSTIQTEMKNGWEPKTWTDLILRLMAVMQVDGGFLDLQLGGEQGRAVLDQCGLLNINPGAGVLVDAEGKFKGVRT
jgi:hypothetical protein